MLDLAIEKLKAIGDNCPVEGGAAVEMCIGILEGMKPQMTPQLAAMLIDAALPGKTEAGVYEAIIAMLCDIGDEARCKVRSLYTSNGDAFKDIAVTLTNGGDVAFSSVIADFFEQVSKLCKCTKIRSIRIDVQKLEMRWPIED